MEISLVDILQWGFPAGLTVGNLFLWRTLKKRNEAVASKDAIGAWKEIADMTSVSLKDAHEVSRRNAETISNLREMYYELQRRITKLEDIVSRAELCAYYHQCPMRNELREYQERNKLGVVGVGAVVGASVVGFSEDSGVACAASDRCGVAVEASNGSVVRE